MGMIHAVILLCAFNSPVCTFQTAEAKINAYVSKNTCISGIIRFQSRDKSYSSRIYCGKKLV